ncbi:hypothetical protein ACSA002_3080 [Salmonella phage vB_SalM_SA002]|nr:hypothetical protein ACSA002_3080 [Salmonella phage vB_SalM_SA002]
MSFYIDAILAGAGVEAFEDADAPVVPAVDPVVPVDPIPEPAPAPVDHIVPVEPVDPVVPVDPTPTPAPEVVDPTAPADVQVPVEPVEPAVPTDPVDAPVDPVDVVPAPVEVEPEDIGAIAAAAVAVAEAEREIAEGNVTIATMDSGLATEERVIEDATAAVAHIQEVQASLEHFIEEGNVSVKTAMLLQDSINNVMRSVGKSGAEITSGGLEAFGDDPDQMLIVLSAGLNALEEEKKSLGSRAMGALKSVLAGIAKFGAEILNQSKRHGAKATELEAAIKGKPEKEVSISSQSLMVGKEYSKDLAGDLNKFKDKLVKGSVSAINDRSNWFFKTAPGIIAEINGAETADAAVAAAAKFKLPQVKGVTISVRDEDGMSLMRSDVVLGNYALFELRTKAAAPSDTASAVAYLKAATKSRITIQRAKAQPPEALSLKLSEGAAAKIITAVKGVLSETESLKGVIDTISKQSLELDANGKGDGDKDVKKIASAASALPDSLVDTVSQLPRTSTRAAMDVVEASLAVVSSFAKGAKAEKAPKDDKGDKGDDGKPDNKDDKSGKGEGEEE